MHLLFITSRKAENEDLEKDKKANKAAGILDDVNYYVYTVYKYYLIIVAYSKIVLLVHVVKQIICVWLVAPCLGNRIVVFDWSLFKSYVTACGVPAMRILLPPQLIISHTGVLHSAERTHSNTSCGISTAEELVLQHKIDFACGYICYSLTLTSTNFFDTNDKHREEVKN